METTELPPEDRPPVAPPRRVSRGLLAAVALATVVLAIATFVAFRADDGSDVTTLDPNATIPADQPLGGGGLGGGQDVVGQKLPALDYTLFDGGTAQLATDGTPLVINFWASYCGPCVAEMPAIEQVHQANAGKVEILGLQVMEAAEKGQALVDRTGVTYPLGRDPRGDVVRAFGSVNLPTTVLVKGDGTIVAVHAGELSAAELQALIDQNLQA